MLVLSSPCCLSALLGGKTVAVITNVWLLKTYRPSTLAAYSLTTPLFGVVATARVLGEPIGWRLAVSTLLVAVGVAAATILPSPMVAPATTIHHAVRPPSR
jgi:drug/metabolite transporter (DMT)-like permease